MRLVVVIMAILQLAEHISGQGKYVVVAPGTIHSDRNYSVTASVHGIETSCSIEIGITGPAYNQTQIIEFNVDNQYQFITFNLPSLQPGDYYLIAQGVSDIEFQNSTKLNFEQYKIMIQIQLDKVVYQPGDDVNFRLIFLDENLRPAMPKKKTIISILDEKMNRIKDYRNVTTQNGVFTSKFELSEFVPTGTWRMNVENGDIHKVKTFEVRKIEPSDVFVTYKAPSKVAIADGDFEVIVEASYMFEEPATGRVTFDLEVHYKGTRWKRTRMVESINLVNGRAVLVINAEDFKKYTKVTKSSAPLRLYITFTVDIRPNDMKLHRKLMIELYGYRYKALCLDFKSCHTFVPDITQKVSLKLIGVNNSALSDTKAMLRLSYIETIQKTFFDGQVAQVPRINKTMHSFTTYMNELGVAEFEVKVTNLTQTENFIRFYTVTLNYFDETDIIGESHFRRNIIRGNGPHTFQVVKQRKPGEYLSKIGANTTFILRSGVPIEYFYFVLTGSGNLQDIQLKILDTTETEQEFTIQNTFSMAPYGALYVYYVDRDGNFYQSEVLFPVEVELHNKISITAPDKARPGEDVAFLIKTSNQSFVGLVAVDKSLWQLSRRKALKGSDFNWILGSYNTRTPKQKGFSYYPGLISGLVTLTNAHFIYNYKKPKDYVKNVGFDSAILNITEPAATEDNRHVSISNYIPHSRHLTWFFADIQQILSEEAYWTKPVPDTANTWMVSAFALHPEYGLGITDGAIEVQTVKKFFLKVSLPYAFIRGEEIVLKVFVHNNMFKEAKVDVTFSPKEAGFQCSGEPMFVAVKFVKSFAVAAKSFANVVFSIQPKHVGNILLNFTAVAANAQDTIEYSVKVLPEGNAMYFVKSFIIDFRENRSIQKSLPFQFPEDYIEYSEDAQFAWIGDLLGPVLTRIDRLLALPTGTCDQIISIAFKNSLIRDYLENGNELTPEQKQLSEQNIEQGYQAILKLQEENGSFSPLGPDGREVGGSIWLTAYIVSCLNQLSKHIEVNTTIIDKAIKFLISKQAIDGSFSESDDFTVEEQKSDVSVTAGVLLAFLSIKQPPQAEIEKCVTYLESALPITKPLLPQALAAYALKHHENGSAYNVIEKLKQISYTHEDRRWWSERQDIRKNTNCKRWWCFVYSHDVQLTSYMLLTLLDTEPLEDILPIVKWLVEQRYIIGGYGSTPDTDIGLQAIIKFALKSGLTAASVSVQVLTQGCHNMRFNLKIAAYNNHFYRSRMLPKGTKMVHIEANGTGVAIMEISYRYYSTKVPQSKSFKLDIYN